MVSSQARDYAPRKQLPRADSFLVEILGQWQEEITVDVAESKLLSVESFRQEGRSVVAAESKTDERKAAFTIISRLENSNRGHWPLRL